MKAQYFDRTCSIDLELAHLRSMQAWLPENRKQEFMASIGRIEKELRSCSPAKLNPTGLQAAQDSRVTAEEASATGAVGEFSICCPSASIMIFESPTGRSEQPTASNTSPMQFYCNEEQEALAIKEERKRTALVRQHFSPILEVMDEGSTAKKPSSRQPQLPKPNRRRKYNYLEGIRPYLY